MNSTRLTSAAVFVVASGGLILLAAGEDWPRVLLGALLVAGSAVLMTRHFWREGDKKRKQELAANQRAIANEISRVSDQVATSASRIADDIGTVAKRVDVFTQGVMEYVSQLEIEVDDLGHSLPADIGKRLDVMQRTAEKDRDKILTQVSGVIGVYSTLQPSIPYPPFGGWAIGGDCAQRLVSLIFSLRPRWILEAGSGLSTILAAQCLDRIGSDGMVISLEHEKKWLEETQAGLAQHEVSHRSQLHHTPLVDIELGGEGLAWYDIGSIKLPDEVGLIFIDGPPKAVGPLARYPAVPLLYDRLKLGGVILMDDAARAEELSAINRWKEEFPSLEFQMHSDSKGTVEITKAPG